MGSADKGSSKPVWRFLNEKNGRADPLPLCDLESSELLLVNRLLELGPRSEFRDLAGCDLDSGASLRVAAVSRLALRHGERAEAYQRYPISFAESRGNAVHGGINGGCSLCFADLTRTCDLVNQIGLIHSFSSQVSLVPSLHREENWLWLSWET